MTPKFAIIIPVYNHGRTIKKVIEGALKIHSEVWVVDDGSSDEGILSLAHLSIPIIRLPENIGKGNAIRTAAKAAIKKNFTHIITMDADGQHDPNDIPKIIETVKQHPHALIVGHRDFDRADVPGSSAFGRSFSNFWFRVQTGQVIHDSQSGFRAYPLFLFENLTLKANRFAFEVEVLVKTAWAGIPIIETDVSVYYPPKEMHISHFHRFYDNASLSVLNTHLTLRAILPWPHTKLILSDTTTEISKDKVSLRHPIHSIRLLLKENATPGRLALAGAIGVFLGALPLIALHSLTILITAGFFRTNKIAALSASQLCMPPLVPALCIEVGYFLRHGYFLTEISLKTLGNQALERIWEWFLGSLIVAPLLALLVGGSIYTIANLIKK
jgi:glycosyltransferase involved in cell wall biosynthesis